MRLTRASTATGGVPVLPGLFAKIIFQIPSNISPARVSLTVNTMSFGLGKS